MRRQLELRSGDQIACAGIAWIGEEKLARMRRTLEKMLGRGESAVPAATLVGAMTEMREGDIVWVSGAKAVKKALRRVECAEEGGEPVLVGSWKAARKAAEGAMDGQVALVFGCAAGGRLKAGFRKAIKKAGNGRLAMVFVVEGGDDPAVGFLSGAGTGGVDFPRIVVDGDDLVAVFRVAQEAIARARRGQGPAQIVWQRA